ncbi:MAG TPA: hypothetical protein VIK00_06685 [Candidatus Limnocylindrales bacterium]
MIVVVGRPGLDDGGELDRLTGRVAAAAATNGARVEIVGSVADDESGDETIVALGRARVGHAALLRVPAGKVARLDAADIELGLRYVADCRVLVVADELDSAALSAAVDGARYHSAQLVIAAGIADDAVDLPDHATVLTAPDEDAGAFAELVGRYIGRLDAGSDAADAWRDALSATGWEPAADGNDTGDEA